MKIKLCEFQEDALKELIAKTVQAQDAVRAHGSQQILSFSAPTGSGKTIIMMALFESLFNGNPYYPEIEPAPETTILWLSDSPELNEQTLNKFYLKTSNSLLRQATVLDAGFDHRILQPGFYFLNTQKLSKSSTLTRSHTDAREYSIWETIENTVASDRAHVLLVIDEAHKGTKTPREAKEAASIMQKFLMGSPADGLSPMPLVIGMTATPQRFNRLIECVPSTTIHKVTVPPERVRASGLLKDHIYIRYPQSAMTPEMTLLEAAADNWREKCVHWAKYTRSLGMQPLHPIFVIQVEDGGKNLPTTTDLNTALDVIEKRVGHMFEPHEVVHTFIGFSKLAINGLEVDYLEPSAIDDDPDVKVVFFKMNLSTGWDCPRAETMMSFRRAQDGTYIAQLLGRMVRTPLARRIAEDESLNDVALYLPKFDKQTVEEVVKALQAEELPTDIDTSNTAVQKLSIPGLNAAKDDEEDTVNPYQPVVHPQPEGEPDTPPHISPSPAPEATDTPSETQPLFENIGEEERHRTHPASRPMPTKADPQPAAPVLDRAKMFYVLNHAGLATYTISSAPRRTDFQSLLRLAHLLTRTAIQRDATKEVVRQFVRLIHNTIEDLKAAKKYEEHANAITDFRIESKVIDAFGMDIQTADKLARQLVTSEIDIERQFEKAERQLGLEGIGNAYLKAHGSLAYLNRARLEVIVFMNDPQNLVAIEELSTKLFHQLRKDARLKMIDADPADKAEYNNICNTAARIASHNFELPGDVDFPLLKPGEGKTYHKHLLCNADGDAIIKLNPWEDGVLAEEAEDTRFVCWLRNLNRKPWALAIPYKKDDKDSLAYPDLLIIRKNADVKTGYVVDVLEPHDPTRTDNLPKAKGFAAYAKNDGQYLGRIQLIRKKGKSFVRLDLTDPAVQEGIEAAETDTDLTKIFETYGITGTN